MDDDDDFELVPVAVVASPCVGICRVDAASRTCLGCLRTLDEIAEWPHAGDARRQQILDRLATETAASRG